MLLGTQGDIQGVVSKTDSVVFILHKNLQWCKFSVFHQDHLLISILQWIPSYPSIPGQFLLSFAVSEVDKPQMSPLQSADYPITRSSFCIFPPGWIFAPNTSPCFSYFLLNYLHTQHLLATLPFFLHFCLCLDYHKRKKVKMILKTGSHSWSQLTAAWTSRAQVILPSSGNCRHAPPCLDNLMIFVCLFVL